MPKDSVRRFPVGAEPRADGTHFRVWAPFAKALEVSSPSQGISGPKIFPLHAEAGGYFSGSVPGVGSGFPYKFRLDENPAEEFPDPASRFQPNGPFSYSEVVDPAFNWTDTDWRGVTIAGQIVYEMHIGTFTKEGTWKAASEQLKELSSAGITIIELMPIGEFAGEFGWGYDGVNLFAPTRLYGTPDDFRHFVDTAHACGIGVLLDVVYNHLGPDGNFLSRFSKDYFSARYSTDWGEAINFDGDNSGPVREYFLTNAAYWIDEFHLDGLRVDATQNIYDDSSPHILGELSRIARAAAHPRTIIVIAENEPQDSRLVRPAADEGYEFDGMWNDDFHHSAMVAMTGRNEAYYTDYHGLAQEFISTVKYGFLYQGQRYSWQKQRRGKPALDLPPCVFINFIQNHDQVANSARGLRVHQITSPGRLRAITALMMLAPGTPMLFQGQEFASSTPFLYFADHNSEISKMVLTGRREFLSQFRSIDKATTAVELDDPGNVATFERCKLDFSDRERHADVYDLHKDLIQLRRHDSVFQAQRKRGVDGSVLGARTFVLRYFGDGGDDRLLLLNLGMDLDLTIAAEPLLAPSADAQWAMLLSTEDPKYGGSGAYSPEVDGEWRLPGEAAVVLKPVPSRIGGS